VFTFEISRRKASDDMRSGDCEGQENFILPEIKSNMSMVVLAVINTFDPIPLKVTVLKQFQ
jgi:hypothetical protein